MDPTAQFKENQKAAWSSFALFENMTGTVAPRLVFEVLTFNAAMQITHGAAQYGELA